MTANDWSALAQSLARSEVTFILTNTAPARLRKVLEDWTARRGPSMRARTEARTHRVPAEVLDAFVAMYVRTAVEQVSSELKARFPER
jgi:hypothetical protein